MIDVFSGFVLLRALKSTTAAEVARAFWEACAIFGLPKIVQSDNGPEFSNAVMRALVKLIPMEHRFITPYDPHCDCKVERAIGTAQ